MKLTGWCGAAAIVAVMASVLVSAAPASAAQTVLCKVEVAPCPAASRWEGIGFEMKAENPKIVSFGPTGELTCASSTVSGTLGATGSPQKVSLSAFTFATCKFGATACKVSGIHLGDLDLLRTAFNLGEARFLKTEIFVQCGATINCVYGGEPVLHLAGSKESEGKPAMITASSLVLTPVAGEACPSKAMLTATFAVLVPYPAFVSF